MLPSTYPVIFRQTFISGRLLCLGVRGKVSREFTNFPEKRRLVFYVGHNRDNKLFREVFISRRID